VVMLQWQTPNEPTPFRFGARVLEFNGLNWVEGPLLLTSPTVASWVPSFLRPHAVAIESNLIAIGEMPLGPHNLFPGEQDHDSVHLFRFDGIAWNAEQILTPLDNERQDWFGSTIAIQGDLLAIGAPGDSHGLDALQVGSVYVYRYDGSNWIQEAKIIPPVDSNPGEMFGYSVAIQGNELFVGAPKNVFSTIPGSGGGRVFTFRKIGANWVHETVIIPSDSEDLDRFGASIDVDGNVLVVSAYRNNHEAILNAGSVYVLRNNGNTWQEEIKITASDDAEDDFFGFSLDVHANTILIGAPNKDLGGHGGMGASYLFYHDGVQWLEQAKSIPDNPLQNGVLFFGNSVALSDSRMLVGSSCFNIINYCLDLIYLSCGGAVHEYAHDCNGNGILDLTETANGQTEDCNNNFVPDECEDCNNNGVADHIDILSGTSTDCNENCLPDECELAGCQSPIDCNANGIIDSCDIASGASLDLNETGIPDECEVPVQPDSCPQTTVIIPDFGAMAFNTFDAHTDGSSEKCGQFESDIWFKLFVTQSCFFTVNVCNASFEVELAAYANTSCPSAANQATACSSDNSGIGPSITIPYSGPGSILIRIGGVNGQQGWGTLKFRCTNQPPCLGDIFPPTIPTGDGKVDMLDLILILDAIGPCHPWLCFADITPPCGNGMVNIDDLVTLLNNFGPCE